MKYECKKCGFSALPLSFIPENNLKELKDNKIKDLTDQIENLKLQLNNQNGGSIQEKNDFKITFKSNDEKNNYTLDCRESDKFTFLEDKLFEKYKEYSDLDVSFSFNGKKIKERKTLKENNISNEGIIMVNFE